MFMGIAAERIEISVTDSEQQESVLRFIQSVQQRCGPLPERLEVQIDIHAEFAFGGHAVLLNGRGQESHLVVQRDVRVDLRPDGRGLRTGGDPG